MSQNFNPGELVWLKLCNFIWWPGRVVDAKNAPFELQQLMNCTRNPIAMVFFESNNTYDIAIDMDKVSLYSCPNKMDFVEKGYSLYLKEQKGSKIQNFKMVNFIKDVISFEKEINGNVDIFKEFEKKDEEHEPPCRELIHKLFLQGEEIKKLLSIKKSLTKLDTSLKINPRIKSTEVIEKDLSNSSIDPNKIEDPIPSVSGTNTLKHNSDQENPFRLSAEEKKERDEFIKKVLNGEAPRDFFQDVHSKTEEPKKESFEQKFKRVAEFLKKKDVSIAEAKLLLEPIQLREQDLLPFVTPIDYGIPIHVCTEQHVEPDIDSTETVLMRQFETLHNSDDEPTNSDTPGEDSSRLFLYQDNGLM